MTTWQLTIDCADPAAMVDFWTEALGYEPAPPPDGFESWNRWYLDIGVPDDELDLDGDGTDRIVDPTGGGPRIWFQKVPETKSIKNRLHLDIYIGGGREVPIEQRRRAVDNRAEELTKLGATIDRVANLVGEHDHYYIVMKDPEGNEFCLA